MQNATQFLKNSFKKGFYFDLIKEFKKNDRYVDFVLETKKTSEHIDQKFKGVQIIRHKKNNKI